MIGAGVTLITGLPGSGKTALVVSMLTRVKDRPVFVMGIPDLTLPHFECPPVAEWVELRKDKDDPTLELPYFTFPANSIVVLDEAQRVYRPRPVGSKVPDIVAAFETRRHTGVDFVLLTQDATFVDSNVRKLTARHIHIHVTSFGRYRLEWQGVGDPREASSRDLAARNAYKPDKAVFDLYKSAELHTKSIVRRPWLVYAFVPLVLALVGTGFYVKHRMAVNMSPGGVVAAASGERSSSGTVTKAQEKKPLTGPEYIATFAPRVVGLPHTAPAYDEVTAVAVAPEPVGCFDSRRTGCKCVTQQGTPYDTTDSICRQILAHGLWMPWKQARSDSERSNGEKGVDRGAPGANSVPVANQVPPIGIIPRGVPGVLSATAKAG